MIGLHSDLVSFSVKIKVISKKTKKKQTNKKRSPPKLKLFFSPNRGDLKKKKVIVPIWTSFLRVLWWFAKNKSLLTKKIARKIWRRSKIPVPPPGPPTSYATTRKVWCSVTEIDLKMPRQSLVQNRLVVQVATRLSLEREVWSSNSGGQIWYNVANCSPPLRHFFERSCVAHTVLLAGAMTRRWAPRTRFSLRRNTASIMRLNLILC